MNSVISKLDNTAKLNSTANQVLKKSKVSLETELRRVREENSKIISELQTKEIGWKKAVKELELFKKHLQIWKDEKSKQSRALDEYKNLTSQMKEELLKKQGSIEEKDTYIRNHIINFELNEQQFDQAVIQKLEFMGIKVDKDKYDSNARFFNFLISEIQRKVSETNGGLSLEVRNKLEKTEELLKTNQNLENTAVRLNASYINEIEKSGNLTKKLADLEGKMQWAEIVEKQNSEYADLIKELQNDLSKKEDIIADMEKTTDFFTSTGEKTPNLKKLANEGKKMYISDIRLLLEKYRSDYDQLLEAFRNLKRRYEAQKKQIQEGGIIDGQAAQEVEGEEGDDQYEGGNVTESEGIDMVQEKEGAKRVEGVDSEQILVIKNMNEQLSQQLEQSKQALNKSLEVVKKTLGWSITQNIANKSSQNYRCLLVSKPEIWVDLEPSLKEVELSQQIIKLITETAPELASKIEDPPQFFANLTLMNINNSK